MQHYCDVDVSCVVDRFMFEGDNVIPNSHLPLLIYRNAIEPKSVSTEAFAARFMRNRWHGFWQNGIFPFVHYHSTSHEVLAVVGGWGKVRFGGEDGAAVDLVKGDVALIPAGVGHKRLSGSDDFLVLGAYPHGGEWDLMRGRPGERPSADMRIARVPLPERDPVFGTRGPALAYWAAPEAERAAS